MVRPLLLLSLLSLAAATQLQAQQSQSWLCTFDNNERRIELAYLQPEQAVPCEVRYQRDTEAWQTLWSATNEVGYCEQRAEAFVQQQEGWGWRCSLETQQTSEPAALDPVEPETVTETPVQGGNDETSAADSAAQSMAELARTTDFFQAYSVLTPLRLAVIEYHASQGRYPSHLSQLTLGAEQLRDSPSLRDVRLSNDGVIYALATSLLGEGATLRLQPAVAQGSLSYQWHCTTNVSVRHSPQCQLDEHLHFPNR
ncbi:MAG: pilin [Saccharospirillum sp.]|nr:pilin [Saccharospirillum sp.]